MTHRLYELDSYCKEFTARVLSCEDTDAGYVIQLDRTAFFPEGGGQSADTGTLGDVQVLDVQMQNDCILHYTDLPLPVNETVVGKLHWEDRFSKMQKHTAEHILCGIVHRLYGFNNVGFHLGSKDVTMDFDGELTREQLDHVERLANQAVCENRLVTAFFPDEKQRKALPYRSKSDVEGPLRLVSVDGVDLCACCAPHVAHTGEIGTIKMLEALRYKGGIRIHIQAGADAVADYQMRYHETAAAASLLSVKQDNLTSAVSKLLEERDALRLSLKGACRRIARLQAERIEATEQPVCLFATDWDTETLRTVVNSLSIRCSSLCVAFSGSDGQYTYVLGGHGSVKEACSAMNGALNGRGGGSDQQMQGCVQASRSIITSYWEEQGAKIYNCD